MRYYLLFLSVVAFGADVAPVTIMEEIICKVNGDIITRGEVERDRKEMETELRRNGLAGIRLQEALTEQAKNILRERIDQLLLVQKAKELDIKVDTELTKQLADIQRNAGRTVPGLAEPEKFQQYVREQTGMPFEDYKSEMKNKMLRDRVIREEIARKIIFKKEDLRAYYDEHKSEFMRKEKVFLREIFVSTENKDAAAAAAAEKKAKDLSARGKKGERFGEMAQVNSDAPNAAQGGDAGSYEKGMLRPEVENAVWNQPRGSVTEPIKMSNGFAIYKIEEHQKEGLAEFEEVEPEVQDKLFYPKMQPALREYLTKIRATAFLEIKQGYEDSGAAPGKNTAWTDPATLKPETVTKEEVAAKGHRKKLMGLVPIPGTSSTKAGTSSSR
jgi:peptidyl-prolyl cis-trans isomerase SurA